MNNNSSGPVRQLKGTIFCSLMIGLCCFFDTRSDEIEHRSLPLNVFGGNDEVLHFLLARQDVHRFEQDLLEDHHQTASSYLSLMSLRCDRFKGVVCELEVYIVELELALILLQKRVLRFGKDLNKRGLVLLPLVLMAGGVIAQAPAAPASQEPRFEIRRFVVEGASLEEEGEEEGGFVGSEGRRDTSSELVEDQDFEKGGQGAPEGK